MMLAIVNSSSVASERLLLADIESRVGAVRFHSFSKFGFGTIKAPSFFTVPETNSIFLGLIRS